MCVCVSDKVHTLSKVSKSLSNTVLSTAHLFKLFYISLLASFFSPRPPSLNCAHAGLIYRDFRKHSRHLY